jgi:5'/3'-nucleotidase
MRILVTNDDGVDSVGLHVLARSLQPVGEVVVAAPDREYSGAGAGLGALHLLQPEIHRIELDGVGEAWSVSGPPALCVMFARLGAFGPPFDLVVAGINPGANVGRAVYHSGTVGAALTARAGGISGVAVSQAVTEGGVEGQGWDEMLADQRWDTAGTVAARFVGALGGSRRSRPVVVNINVPNCELADIRGWRHAAVGAVPPRTVTQVRLDPKIGHEGSFHVRMQWGDPVVLPEHTDGGAVGRGEVAVTYLTALAADEAADTSAASVLDGLFRTPAAGGS